MKKLITLNEFITSRQSDFPHSKGELSRLLSALRLASKIVNREVGKAGLIEEIIGSSGNVNIQDEDQQKLDVYANNEFIAAMLAQEEICGIGSEENDDFIAFENEAARQGNYIVLMDPLDGSSNIDVNVSIGSIFSIYRRVSKPGEMAREEDFLQKGNKQVAAGYVIYGSSTMLVYSTGNGVNGFTLDPSIGVFILSHPNMKFPEDGKIYSVNEGNFNAFSEGVKDYITNCKNRSYSARYIGSFVADFHRNMIKGGIYMYPATTSNKNGKLRLLYENNPLAFIAEQAGGKASTGTQNVLDIKPTELHQRTPLFIGSKKMVEEVEKLIAAEQK